MIFLVQKVNFVNDTNSCVFPELISEIDFAPIGEFKHYEGKVSFLNYDKTRAYQNSVMLIFSVTHITKRANAIIKSTFWLLKMSVFILWFERLNLLERYL